MTRLRMLDTNPTRSARMTASGPDLNREQSTHGDRKQAPFDLVPGLAEDFAAAGAAFVAACGGNSVLKGHDAAPDHSRNGRFPP